MSKTRVKRKGRKTAPPVEQPVAPPAPGGSQGLLPAILIALFLPALFLVPYHFPVPGPNNSQSWEFGFSNSAAQGLIAILLLALFALLLARTWGGAGYRAGAVASSVLDEAGREGVRPLLLTMLAFQAVTCAILLWWYCILPYTHYGELTYFMQRVEAMTLGRFPYRDFTFEYGPGMIAAPYYLYRLFGGALSVEAAYATILLLHYSLGFALLAYLVSQVRSRGRALIFTVLAIPFVNLSMGLNYTPLRFTVALTSLFAMRHLERLTKARPGRRMAVLSVAAFLFPVLNFAMSPEMGMALTFAFCVYFSWFLFGPEKRLALLVLPVIAGLAAVAFVLPRDYFISLVDFGKGGANFPIFPTVHILLFLATAIWVFPRLGVIAIRERSAAGPFCAGLAVMCGLFIVPATGRCDEGHIYFNSLGIFLLAISAATLLAPRVKYAIVGAFFLIFPVLDQFGFWGHYKGLIEGAYSAHTQLEGMTYQRDNYEDLPPGSPLPPLHCSKLLPTGGIAWLTQLSQGKIGVPLGADEITERYLLLSGRSIPEYYIDGGDIFEMSQFSRKYDDMRGMKYILVPNNYLGYLSPMDPVAFEREQGKADCEFMSGLLLFPVHLSPVHPLLHSEGIIMHHIAQEYELVKQVPGYVLLQRKE